MEEDYRIASIYFALCDDVIFMQVNQASLELAAVGSLEFEVLAKFWFVCLFVCLFLQQNHMCSWLGLIIMYVL